MDLSLIAYGPTFPSDSLEQVFESTLIDSVKYNTAKTIMRQSFETDAHLGLKYAILSFDLAKKLKKTDRYAFHHNTKGLFLTDLGRYHEAVNEFKEGLESTKLIEDERSHANFQSSLYINLGLAYGYLAEIELEQTAYLKALKIAEEYDFVRAQAILSNNLSKLYLDLENLPKAKIYIDKALSIIENIDYPQAKVLPFLNLGSYFSAKNLPDSATKYFEIGLEYSEASGSLYDQGAALIQISEHLNEQGKYEKALMYSKRAFVVVEKLGNIDLLILTDLAMAKVKRQMGSLKEAEFCVNRALSLLDEKVPLTELKIYEEIERIALAKSDFKQAQEVGMKIRLIKDTLLDINRQNYISNAESRLDLERMKTEGFEKDRKLHEQEIRERTAILGFSWLALFLAIIAGIFLIRNISQRKNYNKELEKTVRQRTEKLREVNLDLEEANFELKRFNRIISHDLKAPLQNIKGLLEFVKEEDIREGKESQHVGYIQQSTDQLMRLLEDVSLFYNFEKGQLARETFSMKELLEGVELALQCAINEGNVAFTFSDMPNLHSYWTPVFLTFKNLVENAIKYNESENPVIEVSYVKSNKEHIFLVSDNGIGIAENHFDKVFELFQRVSPKGKYNGSGVGLSVSKKMIQKIGGEVNIKESFLNKGSVFEVKLPLDSEGL